MCIEIFKQRYRIAIIPLVFVAAVLLAVGSEAVAQQVEQSKYDLSTFEGRARLIVDSMATEGYIGKLSKVNMGKTAAYAAMAQFAKGNVAKGRQLVRRHLQESSTGMFWTHAVAEAYFSYKDQYGQALRKKVKTAMMNKPVANNGKIGGNTENHHLMYASAGYLFGQEWEDYPRDWYRISRNYLLNWFKTITDKAMWEYDSATYLVHHMGPILTVAAHAPEGSKMKQEAQMALEWYILSVAGQYLSGYWITAPARDKFPSFGHYIPDEGTAWAWLLFGGQTQPPSANIVHGEYSIPMDDWKDTLPFALLLLDKGQTHYDLPKGHYKLPEIIRRIATDRDKPFVHRETSMKNPMKPRVYSYLNPAGYGMAAYQYEGGKHEQSNQTRWEVKWIAGSQAAEPSTFFMKHKVPQWDWTSKFEWEGASKGGRVLQHKGTLLAVYDIKDGNPWIEGPIYKPAFKAILQREGWYFFHTGPMLMAIWADKELYFEKDKKMYIEPLERRVNVLRSDGAKNGLIVETAPAADFQGGTAEEKLDRFADAVLNQTSVDTSDINREHPSLAYKSLSGDTLEIAFDRYKRVNGKDINFTEWPLLGDLWMHQKIGGRYLTLEHGGQRRIYDFDAWTVEEKPIAKDSRARRGDIPSMMGGGNVGAGLGNDPEGLRIRLQALQAAGVGRTRTNMGEPYNDETGEVLISEAADEVMRTAYKYGIEPLITFNKGDKYGPVSYEKWYKIGQAYAERYRPGSDWWDEQGVSDGFGINFFSAVNEPHLHARRYARKGIGEPILPGQYHELMEGLADGIHSVDPALTVIPGGYSVETSDFTLDYDPSDGQPGYTEVLAGLFNGGTLNGLDLHIYLDDYEGMEGTYENSAQYEFDHVKKASGITADINYYSTEFNVTRRTGYSQEKAARQLLNLIWDNLGVVKADGSPATVFAFPWNIYKTIGDDPNFGMARSLDPWIPSKRGSVLRMVTTLADGMHFTHLDPKDRGEYLLEGAGQSMWVWQNRPAWSSIAGSAYRVRGLPEAAETLRIYRYNSGFENPRAPIPYRTVRLGDEQALTIEDLPTGETLIFMIDAEDVSF